jgi:hypothetical protein
MKPYTALAQHQSFSCTGKHILWPYFTPKYDTTYITLDEWEGIFSNNMTTHAHNKWLRKVLCSLHYMSYEVTDKPHVILVAMAHISTVR